MRTSLSRTRIAKRSVAVLAGLVSVVGVGSTVRLTQPKWLARLLARQGVILFAARPGADEIAITVDDGPDEHLSTRILEVLAQHQVPATFFHLGSAVEANPSIVRAAALAGHEIGNHGWRDRPAVLMSRDVFRRDVERTEQAIRAATGTAPTFLRPGSGWLRPSQVRDAAAMGYRVVLGSIAVLDLTVKDVDRELRFVLGRVQPGAVLVLHEGGVERQGVVCLLARLLPELERRGYTCVPLSRMFPVS